MTNKESYSDKLLPILLKSSCIRLHEVVFGKLCADCDDKTCKNCEFRTVKDVETWLNAEHVEPEPPLLENGDDLKPGDWIMVRNNVCDPWEKRQFLCYKDCYINGVIRSFITLNNHSTFFDGEHYAWRQARLLMEGE